MVTSTAEDHLKSPSPSPVLPQVLRLRELQKQQQLQSELDAAAKAAAEAADSHKSEQESISNGGGLPASGSVNPLYLSHDDDYVPLPRSTTPSPHPQASTPPKATAEDLIAPAEDGQYVTAAEHQREIDEKDAAVVAADEAKAALEIVEATLADTSKALELAGTELIDVKAIHDQAIEKLEHALEATDSVGAETNRRLKEIEINQETKALADETAVGDTNNALVAAEGARDDAVAAAVESKNALAIAESARDEAVAALEKSSADVARVASELAESKVLIETLTVGAANATREKDELAAALESEKLDKLQTEATSQAAAKLVADVTQQRDDAVKAHVCSFDENNRTINHLEDVLR